MGGDASCLIDMAGRVVHRWRFTTIRFGPGASGGAGPKPERIGHARVFVVPNPSGRTAAYPGFAHQLGWFRELKRFEARREASPPRARTALPATGR